MRNNWSLERNHLMVKCLKFPPPLADPLEHPYSGKSSRTWINYLIKKYSQPGQIVLDPFCGSGTVLEEALALGRLGIGIDINPLAIFINSLKFTPIPVLKYRSQIDKFLTSLSKIYRQYYQLCCPHCRNDAELTKIIWQTLLVCRTCQKKLSFDQLDRKNNGLQCSLCRGPVKGLTHFEDSPLEIQGYCPDCRKSFKLAARAKNLRQLGLRLNREKYSFKLGGKGIEFPRDIFLGRGHNSFYNHYNLITRQAPLKALFSSRAWVILSGSRRLIDKIKDKQLKNFLLYCFSNALLKASKLNKPLESSFRTKKNRSSCFQEPNLLETLKDGIAYFANYKSKYPGLAVRNNFGSLKTRRVGPSVWLLEKSSENISEIPANSIDLVITGPPFGQSYISESELWLKWLKIPRKSKGREIICDNERGLVREDGIKTEQYQKMMGRVFKELNRICTPTAGICLSLIKDKNHRLYDLLKNIAKKAGLVLHEEFLLDPRYRTVPGRSGCVLLFKKKARNIQ